MGVQCGGWLYGRAKNSLSVRLVIGIAASFTFVGLTSGLRTSGLVSLVTNWGFGEVKFLPRNLFPIEKEEHHVMCLHMSDPPIPNLHSVRP